MSGTADMLGDAVAGFLERGFGRFKSGDKTAARELSVTPRTIRNWRTRQCTPHGAQLIELMAQNQVLREEINHLIDQLQNRVQERHHIAAKLSRTLEQQNRVLVAAVHARAGADAERDRPVPVVDIVAHEGNSFVVSATYVGPERRRAPR